MKNFVLKNYAKFIILFVIIIFNPFINNCLSKEKILIIGDSNISTIPDILLPTEFVRLPDYISTGDISKIKDNLLLINNFLKKNNIRLIIIHAGTNDIFFHNRVQENILDELLIIIKNFKVEIIITELLPRNDDSTNKIFAFNLKLNKLLKSERTQLIKLYDIFSINTKINQQFFSDDLHLNLEGQKLFIEYILMTLKNSR